MGTCEVEANCKGSGKHCPYCVAGSEYRPVDRSVPFPAVAERQRQRAAARRTHRASEAYRSGRRSNQKGKRREREVAKLLGGERVPLSGALDGHPNDVVLPNGWRTEVKARRSGLAFLYLWLEEADVVAFREPEQPWLFAVPLARFRLWLDGAPPRRQSVAAALAALRRGKTSIQIERRVTMAVHKRKSGFATIRRWIAAENADALLFKADRLDWIVVMDEKHFRALTDQAAS